MKIESNEDLKSNSPTSTLPVASNVANNANPPPYARPSAPLVEIDSITRLAAALERMAIAQEATNAHLARMAAAQEQQVVLQGQLVKGQKQMTDKMVEMYNHGKGFAYGRISPVPNKW